MRTTLTKIRILEEPTHCSALGKGNKNTPLHCIIDMNKIADYQV